MFTCRWAGTGQKWFACLHRKVAASLPPNKYLNHSHHLHLLLHQHHCNTTPSSSHPLQYSKQRRRTMEQSRASLERGTSWPSWACIFCPNRKIFISSEILSQHAQSDHSELPSREALHTFRRDFLQECGQKTTRCVTSPSQK